jgi:hypothetical protein
MLPGLVLCGLALLILLAVCVGNALDPEERAARPRGCDHSGPRCERCPYSR